MDIRDRARRTLNDTIEEVDSFIRIYGGATDRGENVIVKTTVTKLEAVSKYLNGASDDLRVPVDEPTPAPAPEPAPTPEPAVAPEPVEPAPPAEEPAPKPASTSGRKRTPKMPTRAQSSRRRNKSATTNGDLGDLDALDDA